MHRACFICVSFLWSVPLPTDMFPSFPTTNAIASRKPTCQRSTKRLQPLYWVSVLPNFSHARAHIGICSFISILGLSLSLANPFETSLSHRFFSSCTTKAYTPPSEQPITHAVSFQSSSFGSSFFPIELFLSSTINHLTACRRNPPMDKVFFAD